MKILLVDNHTQHKKALDASLAGHDVEIQKYHPGLNFNTKDKDLVILSGGGGEGKEIYDIFGPGHLWYQDEMDFVKTHDGPILGICMGFEIICRAFGSEVEEMDETIEGKYDLIVTRKGRNLFEKDTIRQHEAHKWRVRKAPKDFKVLAKSSTGIEVIKHKKKPIWATQFHPEKGGTVTLKHLLEETASG